jgi:hypothetical protein
VGKFQSGNLKGKDNVGDLSVARWVDEIKMVFTESECDGLECLRLNDRPP